MTSHVSLETEQTVRSTPVNPVHANLGFAVVITHTKGAAVGVFQNHTVCMGVCERTAEGLAPLFAACLKTAQLPWEHLTALALGIGPGGSFTGLRLGAAFANGLLSQSPHVQGWAIKFPEDSPLTGLANAYNSNRKDPAGVVTTDHLVECLDLMEHGWCFPIQEFIPLYGQDPGPVRKLNASKI